LQKKIVSRPEREKFLKINSKIAFLIFFYDEKLAQIWNIKKIIVDFIKNSSILRLV
jgi:hypothetical protein